MTEANWTQLIAMIDSWGWGMFVLIVMAIYAFSRD